jgi:alcohol dehydrogenase class IV
MNPPEKLTAVSAEQWREVCRLSVENLEPSRMVIVHTPSARRHVFENFVWAEKSFKIAMAREPSVEDFAGFEKSALQPQLVVGIGGGKALDAAKVIACWGSAFSSCRELSQTLLAGGKIEPARVAKLILVPSLASSGSETSKAAIISVGDHKTGLRGFGLVADKVVYDHRLWASLNIPAVLHYAFDVFAHLLETTVSLRRTEQSLAYASNGFARLGHWLFTQDANLMQYQEAMEASFYAGLCLATSSTCLPHRIQYVTGPATGTTHVEGIWYLSQGWFARVEKCCPDRLAEAAEMFRSESLGLKNFRAAFQLIHQKSAGRVRRHLFSKLPQMGRQLANKVDGDLTADPTFEGIATIEDLIIHQLS